MKNGPKAFVNESCSLFWTMPKSVYLLSHKYSLSFYSKLAVGAFAVNPGGIFVNNRGQGKIHNSWLTHFYIRILFCYYVY